MNKEIHPVRTARLILRRLQPEDAEVLFRIYQSEGVLRYFPITVPPPLEKVQRFIHSQEEHWERHGYGNWGVLLDGGQEIIGWAGLQYLPELDETEVGFLLDRPWWGNGYATEAAQASLNFGFDYIEMDHMIALVHPENLASKRVIEKCGLVYQETLTLWGIELERYRIENLENL
jgi:RimJ/RimL family protein N-acetyltransferase